MIRRHRLSLGMASILIALEAGSGTGPGRVGGSGRRFVGRRGCPDVARVGSRTIGHGAAQRLNARNAHITRLRTTLIRMHVTMGK
jgi:hypothetical protein